MNINGNLWFYKRIIAFSFENNNNDLKIILKPQKKNY